MYGEVHANRVFYKKAPVPGHKFRQISLHELDRFLVMVHEGEVIQDTPKFQADNPDAEVVLCDTLAHALEEVESECKRAHQEGWTPYQPGIL